MGCSNELPTFIEINLDAAERHLHAPRNHGGSKSDRMEDKGRIDREGLGAATPDFQASSADSWCIDGELKFAPAAIQAVIEIVVPFGSRPHNLLITATSGRGCTAPRISIVPHQRFGEVATGD